jgi:hypothetical protein
MAIDKPTPSDPQRSAAQAPASNADIRRNPPITQEGPLAAPPPSSLDKAVGDHIPSTSAQVSTTADPELNTTTVDGGGHVTSRPPVGAEVVPGAVPGEPNPVTAAQTATSAADAAEARRNTSTAIDGPLGPVDSQPSTEHKISDGEMPQL